MDAWTSLYDAIKLRACFLAGSLSAVPQGKLARLLKRVGWRDIDWLLIALTVTRIDVPLAGLLSATAAFMWSQRKVLVGHHFTLHYHLMIH